MRAISLHQPYASLIAVGAKEIETRNRPAPQYLVRFGDRIAIHAAKKKPRAVEFADEEYKRILKALGPMWLTKIPFGAIVCTARIVEVNQVLTPNDAPQQNTDEYWFGGYDIGRWMWKLADVEKVDPPFSTRGYQGFWELKEEWK